MIKKNTTRTIHFCMKDTYGELKTGTSPARQIKKDTGNFATCANTPVEDATVGGWFSIVLTAAELNADIVTFRASAANCLDYDIVFYTDTKLVSDLNDTSAADVKTAIEAAGSHIALIKTNTDKMNFTGGYVQAQVKGQDNIDFGALQKTSLNAATPSVTVSDKTNFSLISAYDAAKTAAPTTGQIRAELATELGRIDVPVGSRLAAENYVEPSNSDITSIKGTVESSAADIVAVGVIVEANSHNIEANGTQIATVKELAEADSFIDKTKTPWQVVIHKKGNPQTVYLRKKLYDVDGGNITAITTVIGRKEHTA